MPSFRNPKLSLISYSKDWPKIDRPSHGSNGRRAQLAWILSLLSKAEQKGSLAPNLNNVSTDVNAGRLALHHNVNG